MQPSAFNNTNNSNSGQTAPGPLQNGTGAFTGPAPTAYAAAGNSAHQYPFQPFSPALYSYQDYAMPPNAVPYSPQPPFAPPFGFQGGYFGGSVGFVMPAPVDYARNIPTYAPYVSDFVCV